MTTVGVEEWRLDIRTKMNLSNPKCW